MSTVHDLKTQRYAEAETKRHTNEIQKLKVDNARTYNSEAKQKEVELKRMKDAYETRISSMKSEQERKLQDLRKKHESAYAEEDQRLKQELVNLKTNHRDQVEEIKIGQRNEVQDINEAHQKTLNNAREKFLKESAKWKV